MEGPTAVEAGLRAPGLGVARVFVLADGESDRIRAVGALAADNGVPVIAVDERTMRSLAQTQAPQGIVAVARFFHRPVQSLAEVMGGPDGPGFALVLHEIADPGNAGTLVRSADALGARAICCGTAGVDPYNEKVVRASMGSLFHIPLLCYDEWRDFAAAARAASLRIVAADAGGPDVRAVTLPSRLALLVGHERKGLAAIDAGDIAARVGIPQRPRAESLNAAVAGSIVMYEIARAIGSLPTSGVRTNDP